MAKATIPRANGGRDGAAVDWADALAEEMCRKPYPSGAKTVRQLYEAYVAKGGALGFSRYRHQISKRKDLDSMSAATPNGMAMFYWPKA